MKTLVIQTVSILVMFAALFIIVSMLAAANYIGIKYHVDTHTLTIASIVAFVVCFAIYHLSNRKK